MKYAFDLQIRDGLCDEYLSPTRVNIQTMYQLIGKGIGADGKLMAGKCDMLRQMFMIDKYLDTVGFFDEVHDPQQLAARLVVEDF